jgi:hypothetical protein
LAAQSAGPQHRHEPEPEPGPEPGPDDTEAGDAGDAGDEHDTLETLLPHRSGPLRVGTHRSEYDEVDTDDSPGWFDRISHSTWFVPLLLAILALMLILGAYAVGRAFSGQVGSEESSGDEPRLVIGDDEPDDRPSVTDQKPGAGAWDGKITGIEDIRAKAGCTSAPGVDASGKQIDYDAKNLVDGVSETTWRCDGRAIGEKITLRLQDKEPVGEVGLIPGYAKTDEANKADRYAENNRVTRVRWTIGSTAVVQQMSGSPKDRSLQAIRVPRTSTDKVVLEILAVKKGPRNTTAISEVHVGRAGE